LAVIRLIARFDQQGIASQLGISANTVNNHVANIYWKTVRSRIDLLNLLKQIGRISWQITYDVPDFMIITIRISSSEELCTPWRCSPVGKKSSLVVPWVYMISENYRPGIDLFTAGLMCIVPRYPGQLTSAKDFLQVRPEDWIGTAYDGSRLAGSAVRPVCWWALMGGAIAAIIADAFDADALALLAPPFGIPFAAGLTGQVLRHLSNA
jgi:carboxylesterase